jgi:hypothetical protein
MGLAFGLAVVVMCTGCSQQEPGGQSGAAEEQAVHVDTVIDTLAGAMTSATAESTAANKRAPAAVEEAPVVEGALPVNERTRKSIRERFAMMQDPAVQKRIESGDPYSKVSIKRSGHAEQDAYEMARARANGPRDAAAGR